MPPLTYARWTAPPVGLTFALPKVQTREDIRLAVERYLTGKHVALWGDWDLTRVDRRDQAIEWLTDQVVNVLQEATR